MEHNVAILPYDHRSVIAICSCGELRAKQRFGDRAVQKSKLDILVHLEKTAEKQEEYQIGPKGALDCPSCSAGLDFQRKDIGLLKDNEPMIIQCENGHDWDAYFSKGTLFLFPLDLDSGPFSTIE